MKSLPNLIIKEEAASEIRDAYDYYEEQQLGLGEYFSLALHQRLEQILRDSQRQPIGLW